MDKENMIELLEDFIDFLKEKDDEKISDIQILLRVIYCCDPFFGGRYAIYELY